jgi:hypothetical protein
VLLRSLFVLALVGVLAEVMVHGVHALAGSVLHRRAELIVHDEIVSATTAARTALVRAIEAGADPRALDPSPPPPSTDCRLYVRRGCALEGSARMSFSLPPAATPSPCPAGSCSVYEQENDAVEEGRVTVTIAAQAETVDGAVLAARSAELTFRTLRLPPYAALAGQADASSAPSGHTAAGDDAGAAPNGTAPGTLIDVLYENAVTGSTIPANVWHTQVQSPAATRPAWSP